MNEIKAMLDGYADGYIVEEHISIYARNEFVLQYALLRERELTNADAWLWETPALAKRQAD